MVRSRSMRVLPNAVVVERVAVEGEIFKGGYEGGDGLVDVFVVVVEVEVPQSSP